MLGKRLCEISVHEPPISLRTSKGKRRQAGYGWGFWGQGLRFVRFRVETADLQDLQGFEFTGLVFRARVSGLGFLLSDPSAFPSAGLQLSPNTSLNPQQAHPAVYPYPDSQQWTGRSSFCMTSRLQ